MRKIMPKTFTSRHCIIFNHSNRLIFADWHLYVYHKEDHALLFLYDFISGEEVYINTSEYHVIKGIATRRIY